MTLEHCLILGAVLFCIGLLGALTRRNAVVVLFSIEIMLNAANLNFIAFWRFSDNPETLHGPLFTLFTIAVAADSPPMKAMPAMLQKKLMAEGSNFFITTAPGSCRRSCRSPGKTGWPAPAVTFRLRRLPQAAPARGGWSGNAGRS